MAWLRLDDTFLDHPKIIGLTDRDLRTWLTILLYAARYRTGGHIPKPAHRALTLTPARVTLYTQAGLLDRDHVDELHIHDWARYNPADPTGADRQRRYRDTHRNGNRNEDDSYTDVTVTAPRAQAGARVPSPTPREREREPSVPSVSTKTPRARTGRTDGRNLTDLTRAATPNPIP